MLLEDRLLRFLIAYLFRELESDAVLVVPRRAGGALFIGHCRWVGFSGNEGLSGLLQVEPEASESFLLRAGLGSFPWLGNPRPQA